MYEFAQALNHFITDTNPIGGRTRMIWIIERHEGLKLRMQYQNVFFLCKMYWLLHALKLPFLKHLCVHNIWFSYKISHSKFSVSTKRGTSRSMANSYQDSSRCCRKPIVRIPTWNSVFCWRSIWPLLWKLSSLWLWTNANVTQQLWVRPMYIH